MTLNDFQAPWQGPNVGVERGVHAASASELIWMTEVDSRHPAICIVKRRKGRAPRIHTWSASQSESRNGCWRKNGFRSALTLTLSPEEREQVAVVSDFRGRVPQWQSLEISSRWRSVLPLLGGEGRGEGERLHSLLPIQSRHSYLEPSRRRNLSPSAEEKLAGSQAETISTPFLILRTLSNS